VTEAADPLRRFVDAQEEGRTYERALAELRAGRKRSHWIWFVFPQIAGLGHSEMAREYAMASLAQATAYLEHPVLGPRLRESTDAVLQHAGMTAGEILGAVDALKLRSSMTLFSRADPARAALPAGAGTLLRRRGRLGDAAAPTWSALTSVEARHG
jgi:uncharacterized protein (DUF1810 family)